MQTVCLFFDLAHPALIPDVWSVRRGAEMQNRAPNEDHVWAWDAGPFKEALRANPPQQSSVTAAHQDRHALKAIKEVVYHLAEVVNWQFSTSTWRRVLNNRIFCLCVKDEASSLCNRFFFLDFYLELKLWRLGSCFLLPFRLKQHKILKLTIFFFYY